MIRATTTPIRDALLVAGADLLWIRDGLRALERSARANGAGAPARLRALLVLVEQEAAEAGREAKDDPVAPTVIEDVDADGRMTSAQAAVALGCTGRYVRQVCARGGFLTARKVANRWTVAQAEIVGQVEVTSA